MYEKFFYLTEKPFHITPDPRFLFLGKKHKEALDLVAYGINERKGFILLTGEVGTGKTTLCRALLERLSKKTETALILNPVLSRHELVKTIAEDFGIDASVDSVKSGIDAINEFLLATAGRGRNAAVIIDEAQGLSPETLEMIRLLSNLETEKEKLLQIVLVGQPELNEKLNTHGLRQLNQRIIVRCGLVPLEPDETREYIRNRLVVAGGLNTVEFSEDSLSAIHNASRGIPRMINIICDRALTAAFVDEKRVVDGLSAAKAIDELSREGFLRDNGNEGTGGHMAGKLSFMDYTAHIAVSAFLISLIAGIIFGPVILNMGAGLSFKP